MLQKNKSAMKVVYTDFISNELYSDIEIDETKLNSENKC